MSLSSPAAVPGYGLEAPSHASMIAALEKHVAPSEANALWTAACRTVGVNRYAAASPEDLRAVAQQLAKQGGVIGVCANALNVRLISYSMLLKKSQSTPAGAR